MVKASRYKFLVKEDLYFNFINERQPLKKLLKNKELEFLNELKKRIALYENGSIVEDTKLYAGSVTEGKGYIFKSLQSQFFRYRKKLKDYRKYKSHTKLLKRHINKRFNMRANLHKLLKISDLQDPLALDNKLVIDKAISLYQNTFKDYIFEYFIRPPIELGIFEFRHNLYKKYTGFISV